MTTLYRFYDAGGALLYIGIAEDFPRRLGQHQRCASWFASVCTIKVEQYATRREAHRHEIAAIKDDVPAHNVLRYDRAVVSYTLPPRLAREIERYAARTGQSKSRAAEELFESGIGPARAKRAVEGLAA